MSDARASIERMVGGNDLAGLLCSTALIHGHYCVGSAMGVIGAHYALRSLNMIDKKSSEQLVAVVETNNCFGDGIQMVTGCSFGNGSLVYRDYGKMALSLVRRNGEGIRVASRPDIGSLLKDQNPEVLVLGKKPANILTASEKARLIELNKKHSFDILRIPPDAIFTLKPVKVELPSRNRTRTNETCAKCGEKVIEAKAIKKGDQYYCAPCGGGKYGQLDWTGIQHVYRS